MTEIRTERLRVKPFSPGDEESLSELFWHDEIKKTYMLPDFPDEEACFRLVKRFFALSPDETHVVRGIYLEEKLIGFVNDVEIKNGIIELGYVIHPDFWGRGYATEMLGGIIENLGSRGFSILKTGAFAENIASIRVMEKCGMKKTPETETISYRGREHACVYYEIALGTAEALF